MAEINSYFLVRDELSLVKPHTGKWKGEAVCVRLNVCTHVPVFAFSHTESNLKIDRYTPAFFTELTHCHLTSEHAAHVSACSH